MHPRTRAESLIRGMLPIREGDDMSRANATGLLPRAAWSSEGRAAAMLLSTMTHLPLAPVPCVR
jgi:hypothetical protein